MIDIDIRLIPMHPYPPPTPQMYPWCVYIVYTECTIRTSEYVVGNAACSVHIYEQCCRL